MHLAFANQGQGHMRQLHQVSAGTHAAVTGNEGTDAAVHKLRQQPHHIRMDAGFSLQERADARHHGRLHGSIAKGFAGTGGMTADDIVLQVFQIAVVHAPLRHGTESGIDAVDDLILMKLLQETIATLHLGQRFFVDFELFAKEDHLLGLLQA